MISATAEDKKKYTESDEEKSIPFASYNAFTTKFTEGRNSANHKFAARLKNHLKDSLKENRSSRNLFQVGDNYLLKGQYKPAVRYYKEALKADPSFIEMYRKIIQAYVKHKEYDKAEFYFKILLEKIPENSSLLKEYYFFKLISITNPTNNADDLIKQFKNLLVSNPRDYEILNVLGVLYLNFKNSLPEAEKYFKSALEFNVNFFHSLNNLGVCSMRNNKPEEAEKILRKVIKINPPNYPFSYQNLALIYFNKNSFSESLETLQEAKSKGLVLDYHWEHMYGWLLILTNQFELAKNWYLNKIKGENQNNLLYNNLGFCYQHLGQMQEAEKNYKKSVSLLRDNLKKKIPRDVRSLKPFYNLARIAIDRRDIREVEKISKEILVLHKNDAFGMYFAGAAASLSKDYETAEKFYKQALQIDRNIPELYPDYSFILNSIKKDYKKSIDLLKNAIALNYRTRIIYNNLAYSYIRSGDLKEGEKILESFETFDAFMFATRGLLEFKKNNFEKANENYNFAIKNLYGENKKIAQQIRDYENALYFFNNKDYAESNRYIFRAKNLIDSYMREEILELEQKINRKLKNSYEKDSLLGLRV